MWNETIFSQGDLNSDEYRKFISDIYSGSAFDRLLHVQSVIERLIAENDYLQDLVNESLDDYLDEIPF